MDPNGRSVGPSGSTSGSSRPLPGLLSPTCVALLERVGYHNPLAGEWEYPGDVVSTRHAEVDGPELSPKLFLESFDPDVGSLFLGVVRGTVGLKVFLRSLRTKGGSPSIHPQSLTLTQFDICVS